MLSVVRTRSELASALSPDAGMLARSALFSPQKKTNSKEPLALAGAARPLLVSARCVLSLWRASRSLSFERGPAKITCPKLIKIWPNQNLAEAGRRRPAARSVSVRPRRYLSL